MRVLLTLVVLLGAGLLFQSEARAQCCAQACIDADNDGFEDDLANCNGPEIPPHEPPFVAGCVDAAPAACIGGRTREGSVDPLKYPVAGCLCIGTNCVAGDPNTGELLTSASFDQCKKGAAFFCNDGGNATVALNAEECTPQ